MSISLEHRLNELTPEQRELFELFLKKERLDLNAAAEYRAPSNATEETLTQIWSELLGIKPGVDDNYFELGGDSIGIIRMVSQARMQGISMRTEWVFSNPTIAQLAVLSRLQQVSVPKIERLDWEELTRRIREADSEFDRFLKKSVAKPIDAYPLTPSQQGLLYHTLEKPEDGSYLVQWRCRITGRLDIQRFKNVWTQLLDRHEVLRTVFQWVGIEEPMQVVLNFADDTIREESYHGDWQAKANEVFEEERLKAFDLHKPPLMRIRFLRIAEAEWLCFWTHHHLILDGWSQQILLQEFFALYRGEQLPQLRPGLFRDHICALRSMNYGAAAEFWKEQFRDYRPLLRQHHSKQSTLHTTIKKVVPETNRLREALRRKTITLNVLFQTAWAIALTQLFQHDDVVFGMASSGRSSGSPDIENAVGLFINTLPFRFRLNASISLDQLLFNMQSTQARLIEHEWCGLLAIQNWIGWNRRLSLIDSLYVYERFPVDYASLKQGEQLAVQDIETTTHEHYQLVLVVQDEESATTLLLKHAAMDPEMARRCERLLDFIISISEQLISEPPRIVSDLISEYQRSWC